MPTWRMSRPWFWIRGWTGRTSTDAKDVWRLPDESLGREVREPVHPVFGAEQGVGAVSAGLPVDLQDRVSQPASRGVVDADDRAAPAVSLGPAGVHARECFDPILGVLPAGAGRDGYDRVSAVLPAPGLLGSFPLFHVPGQGLRLPARFRQGVFVAEFQGQFPDIVQLSGPPFKLPPFSQDFCLLARLPESSGGGLGVSPEVRPCLFQVELCEFPVYLFGAKAARLPGLSASWPLRWPFPCWFVPLRFHTFLFSSSCVLGFPPRPVRRGSRSCRTRSGSHQGLRVQQLPGLLPVLGAEGDHRLPGPAVKDVEALDVHARGLEPLRHPGQCARLVG